jgi:hypothetical protein
MSRINDTAPYKRAALFIKDINGIIDLTVTFTLEYCPAQGRQKCNLSAIVL